MKKIIILLLLSLPFWANAQNMTEVRQSIKELTAKEMYGRGYLFDGDKKAAKYIANKFEKMNLKKFKNDYFQTFQLDINTFPTSPKMKIDRKELVLGDDFIPKAASKGAEVKAKLYFFDVAILQKSTAQIQLQFIEEKLSKKVLVFPNLTSFNQYQKQLADYVPKILAAIVLQDKLTFSAATYQYSFPVFDVLRVKLNKKAKKIHFELNAQYVKGYQSQNVVAFVKGKKTPEKYFVFSAHYDHLGALGKEVYFPGANDNAAGVAMLFELAEYYSQNPPDYSIVFIAFAAEEAGLLGSKYYVENPLFPLEKIHFLMNLDLIGTGNEGMTIVNGSIFEKQFDLLDKINQEKSYSPSIIKRGAAANSDHYYFYKKDVPSFFIYLRGGIQAYHDVFDKENTLPLSGFENLFLMLLDFVALQ